MNKMKIMCVCGKIKLLIIVVLLTVVNAGQEERYLRKRSASSEDNMEQTETSYDRMNIKYDEYPMVVPKRAAILLDRIMVALHHALEDGDQEGVRKINQLYKDGRVPGRSGKIGRDTTSKLISNYGFKKENEDAYDDLPIDVEERDIQQNSQSDDTRGLQRRGHGEGLGSFNKAGRVYWRCYFNAVTCF